MLESLNHPRVKPLSPAIARDLGFEPRFVDFLFSRTRPPCFDSRIEPTTHSWTCGLPDDVEAAYPLWSANADEVLVCRCAGGIYFAQAFHDDPSVYRIAGTIQGLLAYVFVELLSEGTSVPELRMAAQACGFLYLDDILLLEEAGEPDDGDWNRAIEQFIGRIDSACVEAQT